MASLALFAADDWHVTPRPDVGFDLHYSRFEIDLTPTVNDIGVPLDPDDLSGHVGFVLCAGRFASCGRQHEPRLRAPNIFDIGPFGELPDNRLNIPNENLAPETVRSYDLGFKHVNDPWQWEIKGSGPTTVTRSRRC